jgi:hypothetical protein
MRHIVPSDWLVSLDCGAQTSGYPPNDIWRDMTQTTLLLVLAASIEVAVAVTDTQ